MSCQKQQTIFDDNKKFMNENMIRLYIAQNPNADKYVTPKFISTYQNHTNKMRSYRSSVNNKIHKKNYKLIYISLRLTN